MQKLAKIKVFETFAGIGSQHKALQILKEYSNTKFEYEISATSEWDMWANISYNAIHHDNSNIAVNLSDEEINSFLLKFPHSNDSKELAKPEFVLKQSRQVREMLYSSIKNANNLGSILNISGKDLIKATNGGVDLITYSFPCQDLSMAGKNMGMKKGEGTRSGLLWEIQRIVEELDYEKKLPKYLLLENVVNMVQTKHKDDYQEWINYLKEKGYETKTYKLDASEFGMPQKRKRIFALSVLTKKKRQSNENLLPLISDSKEIIDISGEVGINKNVNDLLKIDYRQTVYFEEAKDSIPNRTPSREKMFNENDLLYTKVKDEQSRYKKMNEFRKGEYIASSIRTITTKQDRNPNSGIINLEKTVLERKDELDRIISVSRKQKANYRFLTPRETFLFMGFDEKDFENIQYIKQEINKDNSKNKKMNNTILYRQSGNSIVVNILVSIFFKILELENGVAYESIKNKK